MPTTIPIIDIGPFLDGSDRAGVAAAVDAACRDIGFMVITGHGVDLDLLHRTRELGLKFFRMPLEQKMAGAEGSFMGYSPFKGERLAYSLGEETPPDLKEGFTIAQPDKTDDDYYTHPDALQVFPENVYPTEPAGFEATAIAYYRRMGELCTTMMEIFAVALGLPADHFASSIDKHFSFFRYVYYPALTEAAEGHGVAQRLMLGVEDWARGKGFRLIGLDVFANNRRARAFYRRMGYAEDSLRLTKPLQQGSKEIA